MAHGKVETDYTEDFISSMSLLFISIMFNFFRSISLPMYQWMEPFGQFDYKV